MRKKIGISAKTLFRTCGATLALIAAGTGCGKESAHEPNPAVRTSNGGADPNGSPTNLSTLASTDLTDNFNDNTRDTTKWTFGVVNKGSSSFDSRVAVREINSRLEISPLINTTGSHYNGYLSASTWSLSDNYASVQAVQTTDVRYDGDTILSVSKDSLNWYRIIQSHGALSLQASLNGSISSVNMVYSATQHQWWRIRHSSTNNTIYWETSANGASWVTQRTAARQFDITALFVELQAGTWGAVGAPGKAIFDNFSVIPAPTPSPTPTASPSPSPSPSPLPSPLPATQITAIWANDGGDKVTQDELRGTINPASVTNSIWNGSKVQVFGARNEVVAFNLILEAKDFAASNVSVQFSALTGPGGATIASAPAASGDGIFDWTQRNIELFYVRYLPINGLSRLSYEVYDERHIPLKMRRPWSGSGIGSGTWADRPNHDKYYPEIAVPMELVPTFTIGAGKNQGVWSDIYIPKNATSGLYTGTVSILQAGTVVRTVPVELKVRAFTLPDAPAAKTMVYLGYGDINRRYTGVTWPNAGTAEDTVSKKVRDRHFQLAHRHKLSLIDSNEGSTAWSTDAPRPEWVPRLDGSLFTAAKGYNGPGAGTGNGVFSIGTYSTWSWKGGTETDMRTHSDAWEQWFSTHSPGTEHFLYLIDESTNYAQTQQWAQWIKNNPGPGQQLRSFATLNLPTALANCPSLDIAASWLSVGDTTTWQNAKNTVDASSGKSLYLYNGKRPASGSFATEDDGVALRELPWGQFKKGISRWFFWESAYYNDYQSGRGQTNVFQSGLTFGTNSTTDTVMGRTGWNYSNGDGVLFYPGTDQVFPAESYGVQGPIVSLRMKHWRRGIQDVDYLTLAMAINPTLTQQILNSMVPKVLWENGISDPNDPTWVRTDISWPTDPAAWESARARLATIIDGSP